MKTTQPGENLLHKLINNKMSMVHNFSDWLLIKENALSDIVDDINLVRAGRLLKPGRSGKAIQQIQRWLSVPESGEYDTITQNAVKKFQSQTPPLEVDGIVGKLTIAQLLAKFDPDRFEDVESVENIQDSPEFEPDPVTNELDLKLPMTISGSFIVDDSVPHHGDAMHSFDRRKSDKFGGRMLNGWESEEAKRKWGRYVKLDQGVGINQAMQQLVSLGYKPDVKDIKIQMDKNRVKWSAQIVKSRDGKKWDGLMTRGSAGGGKANAQNQIEVMKRSNPEKKNWTLAHEIDRPGLNQIFLKYTL